MGCFLTKPKPQVIPVVPKSPETPIYRFNNRTVITTEHVQAWDLFCNQRKFSHPTIGHSVVFDRHITSDPIDIPKKRENVFPEILYP
jgi:hypothetical protein